jgi:hypothetical protein
VCVCVCVCRVVDSVLDASQKAFKSYKEDDVAAMLPFFEAQHRGDLAERRAAVSVYTKYLQPIALATQNAVETDLVALGASMCFIVVDPVTDKSADEAHRCVAAANRPWHSLPTLPSPSLPLSLSPFPLGDDALVCCRKRQTALTTAKEAAARRSWRDARRVLTNVTQVHTTLVNEYFEATFAKPHPKVAGAGRVAVVFVHPKDNVPGHDVIAALARAGVVSVGDNLRVNLVAALVRKSFLLMDIGRPLFRVRAFARRVSAPCSLLCVWHCVSVSL